MKFLLILILSTLAHWAFGQGNLQFNQVLRIGNSPLTVPVGKVWKVESYLQNEVVYNSNYQANCGSLNYHRPLVINGNNYYFLGDVSYGAASVFLMNGNKLPVWLKSGDIVNTVCPTDFASVIEFNIVP
jgi:hypothetical protein